MSGSNNKLTDEEFLFAYLGMSLDEALPKDVQQKFQGLIEQTQYSGVGEKFSNARGKLQLLFQEASLSKDQLVRLNNLVEEPELRHTHEAQKIEEIERSVLWTTLKRRLVIVGTICALVFGVVYFMSPKAKVDFDPLQALSYEAVAFEEEASERINFPSDDAQELQEFFARDLGLGFQPTVLKGVASPWKLVGGSILDYDFVKITVSMYEAPAQGDVFFHFSYPGRMADRQGAELGNYQGLLYRVFTTPRHNIIMWEQSPGVLGVLIGRQNDETLASIAHKGTERR